MRGDLELAGFVLTEAEWAALNPRQRALLLRVAARHADGWGASAPPPPAPDEDAYEVYEVAPAR
jgi:hypothetical protein